MDRRSLQLFVGSMAPGDRIVLRLQRNGSMRDVEITLGEVPRAELEVAEGGPLDKTQNTQARLGISISELTPRIRGHLKLPVGVKGVVVAEVQESGTAAEAGLQPGDLIYEVNRRPVENADGVSQ